MFSRSLNASSPCCRKHVAYIVHCVAALAQLEGVLIEHLNSLDLERDLGSELFAIYKSLMSLFLTFFSF